MDALALLQEDHEKAKKLMRQLEETTASDAERREELFGALVGDLTVHENIEEELFYPALKEKPKAKEPVLEAFEEHDLVDQIVSGIEDTPYGAEEWQAKFKTLKDNVEHHIEEEEATLFKLAREAFDERELEDLGSRMETLKQQELEQLEETEA